MDERVTGFRHRPFLNGEFMGSFKRKVFAGCTVSALFGVTTLASSAFAIIPNKLVSGGLPAHTGATTTEYLTDGYLTNWKSSSAKEIALNVGAGPKKLLINWESYGDCAWATDFTNGCGHSGVALSNFKILTSANSTDGSDGDWEEAATVKNNPVMARGVQINFEGKSWFKFVSEGDVGKILEIEAFDMTSGGTDTWFFMGTSISQMGIKQQETDSTTAQLIHARFPEYTPAMLRGGIGCINSTEVVEHLEKYLEYVGNVKFWAIEMGTNDAWGGGDWNLATYVKNMQTIIDAAKAHGITPVIARIIATNPEKTENKWQINPKFLTALDSLVEANDLPKGPDFYSYFLKHPELLGSDGVHPNSEGGGQAMHHLWAEALAPLYAAGHSSEGDSTVVGDSTVADDSTGTDSTTSIRAHARRTAFAVPQINVQGRNIVVGNVDGTADVRIFSLAGNEMPRRTLAPGSYLVVVRSRGTLFTEKVQISR